MIEVGIIAVGGAVVRTMLGRFFCAGVVLVATAVVAPPLLVATVNCTFSETDLRVVCSSDTDGDTVTRDSFDQFPEPDEDAWVVIDVNDDEVDRFHTDVILDDDHEVPLRWRIVGDLDDFYLAVHNNTDIDVIIEFAGDIDDPTDGRHSARITSGFVFDTAKESDPNYRGRVEGINSGSILSTGDGPTAYGLSVGNYSTHPDAEASAVNKGTIETRGTASRGMQAKIDGSGTAEAINEGTVITRGGAETDRPDGSDYPAHAVLANAGSGGTAVATNASGATINTEGDEALALRAVSEGSGTARATNELGATITTSGDAARGVMARIDDGAGTATAINRGSILTTGNYIPDNRSHGLWARLYLDTGAVLPEDLANGVARAVNSGTIETRGTGARGIRANVEGSGTAVAVNEGSVTTRGDPDDTGYPAHGVNAKTEMDHPGSSGTTQAISGTAQATNERGGTIVTTGIGAFGLAAQGDTAIAINHGAITTTGDAKVDNTTYGLRAEGFSTLARNEARAVNSGTIETQGTRARGMQADTKGSGTATAINEGSVTTTGVGSTGLAVRAVDSTALAINRGNISVLGRTAGISAYTSGVGEASILVDGGTVNATYEAATADEGSGVGLFAGTMAGTLTARIQGNSLIEAPTAARFRGGPADVIVDGSTIMGAIRFDQFNDTLSVLNSTITGDIDFGGGADTLVTQSAVFDGAVTGVSEMFKRGSGVARFNRDVNFSGSSATIEDGTLMFAGDFNLGPEGTMTVYDSARVTALLTAENIDDPPQIIAGGGIVAQDAEGNRADLEIYIQPDETVNEQTRRDQATIQRVAENVIAADTPIMTAGNEVALKNEGQGGETQTIGSIAVIGDGSRGNVVVDPGVVLNTPGRVERPGESCPSPTAEASGGEGLLLAFLLSAEVDLFDVEDSHSSVAETRVVHGGASIHAPAVLPRTGWRLANWASVDGNGRWTRVVSGRAPISTAVAPTVGFDARFGGNFSIDVSASRDLSMSLRNEGAASQLSGGRYSLRSRWHGETLLAGASISRGEWRGQTAFANPVVGGGLAGAFDMNQTHAQAGMGARFDLGGVRVQPSATLFSGTVERAAYRARSGAFRAAVPEIAQRYRGWKAGMRLYPADWLSATRTVRWRPALDLKAMRTRSDAATFTLQQSARKGLLSFSSVVRADAMPETLLAVGVSVDVVASEKWRFRVGYAGMLADGEPEHGVGAGLQIHF